MVSKLRKETILSTKQYDGWVEVKTKQGEFPLFQNKALALWHEQAPKEYKSKNKRSMAGDMASSSMLIPYQHALVAPVDVAALVAAVTQNKRHDVHNIIKSLGHDSTERSEALWALSERDPGMIKKGETEQSMGRGLIHMLVTPTEHIYKPTAADPLFDKDLLQSRIDLLNDIRGEDLIGEEGFKMLMLQVGTM
eukprot:gene20565-27357_t